MGVFGHEEEVLDKPVSPNEIKNILYAKCMPYDICQAVLQQELILAIGKLIATDTEKFDGILKIRIGYGEKSCSFHLKIDSFSLCYGRTSMARTPMACLPRLF